MFDLQGLFDSLFGGPLGDLLALFNPFLAIIEAILALLGAFGGGS